MNLEKMTTEEPSLVFSISEKTIINLRSIIAKEFPTFFRELKLIGNDHNNERKPKGYNIIKRANKRLGYVYYVRYWHEGKMLPSKWNTHTNEYIKACEFAKKKQGSNHIGIHKKKRGRGGKVF